MAKVNTNDVGLVFVPETTPAVPPTTGWRVMEPNDITEFGKTVTPTPRRPISPDRGRKKGTVTDADNAAGFDLDLTLDAFTDFAEGFVFSEFANVEFDVTGTKMVGAALDVITADSYDAGAAFSTFTNGTLFAGKAQWVTAQQASLFYAKGYTNAANNGLKVVIADPAPASTFIQVAGTLVNETAPATASLELAGIQVSDGDLTFTKSGDTATLVSGADIADWTTLGLLPGQYIHIGSATGAGAVQNALQDSAADDTFGYARITSIATTTLNLDKLDTNLGATAVHSGDGVADILFGRFLRNVAVNKVADDDRFLNRTYQFEAAYPELSTPATTEYEYSVGNSANELGLNLPLTDKATMSLGFIGTDTEDIVVSGSRKTGPSVAEAPLRVDAINTSSSIVSLTTDLVTLAADVCFKSLTITLLNNINQEKCLGTLGASFVNAGLFEVNLEGQMLFTNKQIISAINGHTTSTFAAILRNDDGAIAIDIPSLTFAGGDREFPQDAAVLVNVTGTAFNDPSGTVPNVSLGISLFANVPTA